jgi:hypothetical protein
VAQAGQTAGGVRVVLDFLFLLYQDKRKERLRSENDSLGTRPGTSSIKRISWYCFQVKAIIKDFLILDILNQQFNFL